MCVPKEEGGLGFRSLIDVSKASFAKLWWNFRTKNTLWSNYMWNKYCKRHDPQTVEWKGGSQVWKLMLQARDYIDQEIWWEARGGQASLWHDNWTQSGALHFLMPISHTINHEFADVSCVMDTNGWNQDLLKEFFNEEICEQVKKVLGMGQITEERDQHWWMPNNKGKFTVNSAWDLMRQRKEIQQDIMFIWEKGIPSRVSFLLWRMWFQRIPIGEILVRFNIIDAFNCVCCNNSTPDTFDHLFVSCPDAKYLWETFSGAAGIQGPFIQMKQTIYQWCVGGGGGECSPKLKPLFRSVPIFIIWQIWKRRNRIKHGGNMSRQPMVREVNMNIYLMATTRYPWLSNMPTQWPLIVKFLEDCIPILSCKVVKWICPPEGHFKCNTDGSCRDQLHLSSKAFSVRNSNGELVYAETESVELSSILEAEVGAFKEALQYCVNNNLMPVIMETYSLILKKIIDEIWEIPWSMSVDITCIKKMLKDEDVVVIHIFREGNYIADCLTNHVFSFAGTTRIQFLYNTKLPAQAGKLLHIDKQGIPNIRIRKCQNGNFNNQ
ncbi:hypothetical protein KY290_007763 [Solanum tuberosum]|uniref:RNase H family protein n=1 Tax=Solanum tuberosum TaxID=4113 RepID=A0ABQ7W6L4_SOLTU|nr:hypothetical protein KY290_007763 [Solanum tuberosum]